MVRNSIMETGVCINGLFFLVFEMEATMKFFSFISVILHPSPQSLLNPDRSLSLLQLLLAVVANQKQLLVVLQVVLEVWLQWERLGRSQSGSKWVSDESLFKLCNSQFLNFG